MVPYQQGKLDGLCGIYSLVNAERIINRTTAHHSQNLFNAIVSFLDSRQLIAKILTQGTHFKYIKAILAEVIQDRIPYQKRHFAGVRKPDLDVFWCEIASFLASDRNGVILLGITGFHDHWTVVTRISKNQIYLFDSTGLHCLNRRHCTTVWAPDKRHILHPWHTYFLGSHV